MILRTSGFLPTAPLLRGHFLFWSKCMIFISRTLTFSLVDADITHSLSLFQWGTSCFHILFVVYRLFVAASFTAALVVLHVESPTDLFVYLTHWSFLVLTIAAVYQATITTIYYIQWIRTGMAIEGP